MFCSKCGNQIGEKSKFCPKCGNNIISSHVVQDVAAASGFPNKNEESLPNLSFYSIGLLKLFLLSFFTVGLFEIYWFIKNWELIRKQQNLKITPFWRGLFSVIFCHSLFKNILTSANKNGYNTSPKTSSSVYAAIYIVASVLAVGTARAEIPLGYEAAYFFLWIIFFLISLFPVLMVQKAINFNNAKVITNESAQQTFTGKEVVLIVIGVILFCLSLIGWFSNSTEQPTYSEDNSNYQDTQVNTKNNVEEVTDTSEQDILQAADYQEGYKAGYADGRSSKGEFGDNYAAPATKDRRVNYVLGYLDGFLTGCDEGGYDCSQVENYLKEQLREDGYSTQLQ